MFSKYVSVITYPEVFKDKIPDDPLVFIRYLPTEFLLLRFSRINAILFYEQDIDHQTEKVLSEGMFPDTPELLARINLLTKNAKAHHRALFSGPVMGTIIKACIENFKEPDPNALFKKLQVNWDIFRTILLFNELYYGKISGASLQSFEGLFKLDVLQQANIRGNVYHKTVTMLKFAFVSKFLEQNKVLKSSAFEFCRYFGLGNPWLFGNFFLVVLTQSGQNDQPGKNILNIEDLPAKMIDFFSLDSEMLRKRKSVSIAMDIIPKPFFRLPDGEVLILDFNYFQYAFEFGFFYSFYQVSLKGKKKPFPDFNAFQGFIGLEFFEKFLVSSYLEAIFFRRNQKIISTDRFQDFIVKSSANNVFLFEVKMVGVHPLTIENMDFDGFKDAITKNFIADKETEGKNKGISQLIIQIQNIVHEDGELVKLLKAKKPEHFNIYPVIIYNDPNLDISGVNDFVNTEFEKRTEKLGLSVGSIKPLVMLNVNILIEFLPILKLKPNSMSDLINSYCKYIKGNRKRYEDSKSGHRYRQYNLSFLNYLKGKYQSDMLDEILLAVRENFDLDIKDYGKDEPTPN